MTTSDGSRTLNRSVALLKAVADAAPEPSKLAEIALATGLHRATAHRLLNALSAEGLIEPTEHGYMIGPTCWLLGEAAQRRFDMSEIVLPSLRRIAKATGDVGFFTTRIGQHTRCLARAEGDHPIQPNLIRPGTARPLGVGSHGVAQLAVLDDDEIEWIMSQTLSERLGSYPHYSDDYLRTKIAETRRQGFGFADGEVLAGWGGIALVIRNRWDAPVGAISYAAVADRLTPDRRAAALEMLQEERAQIENLLGRSSVGQPP